jgi:hypothetical protein
MLCGWSVTDATHTSASRAAAMSLIKGKGQCDNVTNMSV